MSNQRTLVAAQAAAVGLLIVFVYLTLLKPGSPGPLGGIEVPSQGPRGAVEHEEGEPKAQRERPGTDVRGAGDAVVAAAILAGFGGSDSPTASFTEAGPLTPVDDQYADAAKALLEKVSGARSPRR